MIIIKPIIEDEREILLIHFDDDEGSCFSTGDCGSALGITKIVAYGEPAEYCLVPWLAIYKGEEIWQRLPAGRVRIVYKE